MSVAQGKRLIAAAKVGANLTPMGVNHSDSADYLRRKMQGVAMNAQNVQKGFFERQVRPLTRLEPEQQRQAWQINDQPPYWSVMIRNFDPKRDAAPGMKGDSSGRSQEHLIDPSKNGNWRYTDLEMAKAKFAQLAVLPWCVRDEQKRQELRDKKRQAIAKVRIPFPKKLNALDGVKIES